MYGECFSKEVKVKLTKYNVNVCVSRYRDEWNGSYDLIVRMCERVNYVMLREGQEMRDLA